MSARCPWAEGSDALRAYHDCEWGVPQHDDRTLFGFLVLEGAQAGLSWPTILAKRAAYRRAFAGFDPAAVARFGDPQRRRLLQDRGIVRNRRKIDGAIGNARSFLRVQEEHGSFDAYLWAFVGGEPVVNRWRRPEEVPVSTPLSGALSEDLRRRGFTFAGTTICYAYMQAVGLVNDHLVTCPRHPDQPAGRANDAGSVTSPPLAAPSCGVDERSGQRAVKPP